MRLIDADACPKLFNKEFRETMRLISQGETHLDNLAEGFTEAHRVIQSIPTVDAADVLRSQWISVKDRIPDSNGLFIVTACDEGCSAGEGIWYDTVVVTAEYYKGCWTWYEGGNEYDLSGIVTHWMQMPEPPEVGKA